MMIWLILLYTFDIFIFLVIAKCTAMILNKISNIYYDGSTLGTIADYPKTFILIFLLLISYSTYEVKYPIKEMYKCAGREVVQKITTKYSWWYDACYFENNKGQWIEFRQIRSNPGEEGNEHDVQ